MSHHNPNRYSPHLPASANPQQHAEGSQSQVNPPGNFHPPTAPVEEKVDRLMDEVFEEIERLLEQGGQLQGASAPEPFSQRSNLLEFANSGAIDSQPVSSPTVSFPTVSSSLALLPKLSPRQLTKEENEEAAKAQDDDIDFIQEPASPEKPQLEPQQAISSWLMGIAFVSLLMSSALWLFVRYYLPKAPTTANIPSAAEVLQAKQDSAFLTYVQRAMERIERVSKQAEASTSSGVGSQSSALPPLYVPLPPPPAMATLPSAGPSTVPSPTARVSVAPLPPVATAPATVPSAPIAPAPASTPVIPNIAPSPTHLLLGLLELGDRSAALFEISGAPQRIQVGEAIGSSGWTLVAVSGEEAIVRRNGEVRSVYIGQTF